MFWQVGKFFAPCVSLLHASVPVHEQTAKWAALLLPGGVKLNHVLFIMRSPALEQASGEKLSITTTLHEHTYTHAPMCMFFLFVCFFHFYKASMFRKTTVEVEEVEETQPNGGFLPARPPILPHVSLSSQSLLLTYFHPSSLGSSLPPSLPPSTLLPPLFSSHCFPFWTCQSIPVLVIPPFLSG